jgi:nitrogenase molybdenum-iron protein beta chain
VFAPIVRKDPANAEAVIAKYKSLTEATIARYKPRLQGKKVMLFVGGLRPRHVIGAYEDLGMDVVGTGYEFGHNDDYQRTTHYVNLYKPEMIAVSTTCMAEVIGDDLNAFIKTSKEKGSVPADFDVPFAHTPAFVGSHVTGYDNALLGILQHFWDGKAGTVPALERVADESINFIGGFDGFVVGNMKEIKRMFELFGADYNVLCDPSETWNTPTDGEFRMYEGGTTKETTIRALNAKATIVFQEYSCEKTIKYLREKGQEVVVLNSPIGVAGTDEFVMALARLTGKPVPAPLEKERGQLVDAMADSQAHLHGKRYALYGDPDMMLGLTRFLLELGAEPAHVLATNGNEAWAARVQALFDASPYGKGCQVYPKRDLWHMRSILHTEPGTSSSATPTASTSSATWARR